VRPIPRWRSCRCRCEDGRRRRPPASLELGSSVRESAEWWWRPAADGRFWPVNWEDAEPLMTGVVRCGLVVRGPDVAPLWPRPILRSHEAAGYPFPPPSEPVRAWGFLGEYLRHPGNALVADPHLREG
jgi:hypothetical protein